MVHMKKLIQGLMAITAVVVFNSAFAEATPTIDENALRNGQAITLDSNDLKGKLHQVAAACGTMKLVCTKINADGTEIASGSTPSVTTGTITKTKCTCQ
jgi:hypothetical protein